jgi:hypothetical protein
MGMGINMNTIPLRKTLLTTANAKTSKGESLGYLTGILYLAPADTVEGINLCPFASKGCKASCLFTAGRGKFSNVMNARIKKTIHFRDDINSFMESLVLSIENVILEARVKGLKPCIRLNGTSDIRFEYYLDSNGRNIFEQFPNIQFYDYTKDFHRLAALKGRWKNYHLTFSRSESRANHAQCRKLLDLGVNVAAVFRSEDHMPINSIEGDLHDLRFLDKKGGHIVALKAKGDAKKDQSGFVIGA